MAYQFYYIIADGTVETIHYARIDPPLTEHQDYIDGLDSEQWDSNWVRRLDAEDPSVGYPADETQKWDLINNSWIVSKEALKEAVKNRKINLVSFSMISHESYSIPLSPNRYGYFTTLAMKARLEKPDENTSVEYDVNKNAVTMTNAQALELTKKVFDHFQSILDAEVQLIAQIDNDTLTDTASIDGAFATAMLSPIVHEDVITDLYGTIKGKVDKVTGKGLSTNDFTDLEKAKLATTNENATTNSSDAYLKDRNNHTGTQSMASVSGLDNALNSKQASINSASHIHIVEAIAVNNLETDVGNLRGLIDAEIAIAAGNVAQNAMADIVNEMSAKVNLLFEHLQDQGLQNLHD